MAYYIRVLGLEDVDIHLDELTAALRAAGLKAAFQLGESCAPHKWSMIAVQAENGPMLSQIERNHVVPGKLAHAELQEFREIIRAHQPLSAVNWLDKYFDRITVVYAFRILDAALLEDNFEIVSALKTAIWARTGGLLQNDEEGFSNDNGDHILWQFPDEVSGDKYCAVLDGQGNWQRFRMDLGDHFQRMAFWAGEVPQMAVRLCGKCRDELVPRIRDIRTSDFTTGAGLPLDISLLKPGVYTISLYQGKTQQLGRFIKL